jgi:hypothetical protein
MGSLFPLSTQ